MNVSCIAMLLLGVTTNALAFALPVHPRQYVLTGLQSLFKADCQSVIVVGAVRVPFRFELQRPTHLAELLGRAGGPTVKAGKTVRVTHTGMASVCSDTKESKQSSPAEMSEDFELAAVVRGEAMANPLMKPGDVVVVSSLDVVYVVGAVTTPQAVVLKDGLTLTRAVTLAGGPLKDSKLIRVRLLRVSADAEAKVRDLLILRELKSKPSVDPILLANDIIEVSDESGWFGHGTRLKGGLVSWANLPVEVVK